MSESDYYNNNNHSGNFTEEIILMITVITIKVMEIEILVINKTMEIEILIEILIYGTRKKLLIKMMPILIISHNNRDFVKQSIITITNIFDEVTVLQ